jgi:hypothetical protein
MTSILYRNRCGHDEYEQCFCAVCYPVTNFIQTMMRAASQRTAPKAPEQTPVEVYLAAKPGTRLLAYWLAEDDQAAALATSGAPHEG